MSAEAAVARLMKIHPKGFDLSLDRISSLLEKLGDPHLSIPPTFHIAGTNGKGSTAAFLRAILESAGKTVHVHTSPHLVRWNERYRLGAKGGGKFVSDEKLEAAILRAEKANDGRPITVFEIMSAVAFLLFNENAADFCVMEVGLGGRFDATNVLQNPVACLITPIGMDHEAYLGNTLAKIAFEKAGIIKKGSPVVAGLQEDEALGVIREKADVCQSDICVARENFDFYTERGRFVFQDEKGLLDLPIPALVGDHQLANAALAIAACRIALPDLETQIYEMAMETVAWAGRFERLQQGKLHRLLNEESSIGSDANSMSSMPEIWIDGGHNPHAGKAIARELEKRSRDKPLILIAGMLTTKEPEGFFKAFVGLAKFIYTAPVSDSDAGFDPKILAGHARENGFEAKDAVSVEEALGDAIKRFGRDVRILICGSLYLVGEVLRTNGTPPK